MTVEHPPAEPPAAVAGPAPSDDRPPPEGDEEEHDIEPGGGENHVLQDASNASRCATRFAMTAVVSVGSLYR